MKLLYLHGFATGPEIWRGQAAGTAPELSFHDLESAAAHVPMLETKEKFDQALQGFLNNHVE
jgi:hypothetical protein